MHRRATRYRPLAINLFLVGIAAFLIHESFHWLAGTLLGYPMQMSLNRAWSSTPFALAHSIVISGAGPLVTYVQAAIGYLLVRSRASLVGFAMVYIAFFMRLVAMAVSVFNLNDEARISRDLGIGTWTLPAIVVGALLMLTVWASRRLKLTWREQVVCYIVASIVVSLFVGADMMFFPIEA
ncbi:MAG: hypothetical protein V4704_03535 [Pseudomonadota bacterium]